MSHVHCTCPLGHKYMELSEFHGENTTKKKIINFQSLIKLPLYYNIIMYIVHSF